ncbi:hypothetical protein [Amycolatopsis sp. NPDC003861]
MEPVSFQYLIGQLILTNADSPVYLNDRPADLGDYLVPSTDSRWSIRQPEIGVATGTFIADSPTNEVIASGVLEVAQRLAERGDDVVTWTGVPPLIEDIGDKLDIQPVEQRANDDMPHLQSVCWDPADRLVLVDELMSVARARRIAPQAVRHLSQHSEHWESRTLTGVRPARILGSRPEDDIDRYENRVTARLVQNLLSSVRTRLDAAAKLDAHIKRVTDHGQQFGQRPSWRNAYRLAELLDSMFSEPAPLHDKATKLLRLLTDLDQELTALLGSPVVRQLTGGAVPPELRPTNLFTNDHRYRQVRELWDEWIASLNSTDLDWAAYHQHLCRAFERYVLLVTLLAGEFVGLHGVAGQRAMPDASLTLTGHPAGDHTLCWNSDATFTLSRDAVPLLRIVPLAHALTADSADEVRRCVTTVESAASRSTVPTLVLYPGSQEERDQLPADLRARAHVTIGSPGLVPISPAELDSIERVARALRWHIDGSWLRTYPPSHATPAQLGQALATGWLDHRNGQLRATQPPDTTAWASTIATIRKHAEGAPRTVRHDDPTAQITPTLNELRDDITAFAHCLVCRKPIPYRQFQARDRDTFWAVCPNCKIEWGLRSCGTCGGRYPVLATRSEQLRPGGHGDELDHRFGNELLAEPCRQPRPEEPPSFICTSCGTCAAGDGCERQPRHESWSPTS